MRWTKGRDGRWRGTTTPDRHDSPIAAATVARHGARMVGKRVIPNWRARVTFADYHMNPQSWWVQADNSGTAKRLVERYLERQHDHQACCEYERAHIENWRGGWRYAWRWNGRAYLEWSVPFPNREAAVAAARAYGLSI